MYQFQNERLAKNFAARSVKMMMIVLGDNGRYWVVTMAEGETLIAAGYEVISL